MGLGVAVSILSEDERRFLLEAHSKTVDADKARARRCRIEAMARELFVRQGLRNAFPRDVANLCLEYATTFEEVAEQWRPR